MVLPCEVVQLLLCEVEVVSEVEVVQLLLHDAELERKDLERVDGARAAVDAEDLGLLLEPAAAVDGEHEGRLVALSGQGDLSAEERVEGGGGGGAGCKRWRRRSKW